MEWFRRCLFRVLVVRTEAEELGEGEGVVRTSGVKADEVVLRPDDLAKVGFVRHDIRRAGPARATCSSTSDLPYLRERMGAVCAPGLNRIGPRYSLSVEEKLDGDIRRAIWASPALGFEYWSGTLGGAS